MKKTIILGQQKIEYSVKNNVRSKGLKIHINNGKIVVVKSKYIPNQVISMFLISNKKWILNNIGNSVDDNEYKELRDKAQDIIEERVRYFSGKYGFKYNKIQIRNQKTRWGSCSSNNNLNFNYRLIKLNQNLMDYIIVHELCHTKEHNHSKKFWCLVGNIKPDYKELRRELRQKMI